MTYKRLTSDLIKPEFTESFILADVQNSPENVRRFNEYSGDLSGRFIEALSLTADEKDIEFLHKIVRETLLFQRSDGRFGNTELDFQQSDITGEHMALLWGNGRMLVGLLAYYDRFKDENVLNAAIRVGDFYLTVFDACATPETIQKLDGFGAMGIICFTQYIEGMISLAKITGEEKYIETCKKVYPLLPPRKQQHTHGFLTTLRGVLMLHEYTGDPTSLKYVIRQFDDLTNSTDLTVFGSVPEYFGGKGLRDEGCASADFVRLGMELYHITGELRYLEAAEFALFNAFYFNQYQTGDFGHHVLVPNPSSFVQDQPLSGSIKYNGANASFPMAAWWCCTMHGMRCFSYLKNKMVEIKGNSAFLNLFIETEYSNGNFNIVTSQLNSAVFPILYNIKFKKVGDYKIYIRKPNWTTDMVILKNNKNIEYSIEHKYAYINESIINGDLIQLGFNPKICLGSGPDCAIREKDRFQGILRYGPYLMGVDDNMDPIFTAEPNNNKVVSSTLKVPEVNTVIHELISPLYLNADYHHSGFPSTLQVTFRPIKDLTFEKRPTLLLEFEFVDN